MRIFNQSLLFALSLVLFFSACKKDQKSPDDQDKQEIPEVELSAGTADYQPYELIQLPFQDGEGTIKTKIEAQTEGEKTTVMVSDTLLTFLIPKIEAGEHQLSFQFQEKRYLLSYKTAAPTISIPDKDAYIAEYREGLRQAISTSDEGLDDSDSPQFVNQMSAESTRITALLNELDTKYAALNDQEKEEVAQVIAANRKLLTSIKKSSANAARMVLNIKRLMVASPAADTLNKSLSRQSATSFPAAIASSGVDQELQVAFTLWKAATFSLFEDVTLMASILYVTPAAISLNPLVGTIASGIGLGYMATEISVSLKSFIKATFGLATNSYRVVSNLAFRDIATDAVVSVYEKGVSKGLLVKARMTNLFEKGGQLYGSAAQEIADLYQTAKARINGLFESLPELIRPKIRIPELPEPAAFSKEGQVSGQHIRIEQVSNPKVQLQAKANEDGSLSLTAETESQNDETFSFDVVYTNETIQKGEVRTTLEGKINSRRPHLLQPRGGTGQWGLSHTQLKKPLRVYVSDNRGLPYDHLTVSWRSYVNGKYTLLGTSETDETGIAEFEWVLGDEGQLRVEALLLNDQGQRLPGGRVSYNATSVGSKIYHTIVGQTFTNYSYPDGVTPEADYRVSFGEDQVPKLFNIDAGGYDTSYIPTGYAIKLFGGTIKIQGPYFGRKYLAMIDINWYNVNYPKFGSPIYILDDYTIYGETANGWGQVRKVIKSD